MDGAYSLQSPTKTAALSRNEYIQDQRTDFMLLTYAVVRSTVYRPLLQALLGGMTLPLQIPHPPPESVAVFPQCFASRFRNAPSWSVAWPVGCPTNEPWPAAHPVGITRPRFQIQTEGVRFARCRCLSPTLSG